MSRPTNGLYMKPGLVGLYATTLAIFVVLAVLSLMAKHGSVPLIGVAASLMLVIWGSTAPLVLAFGDHIQVKLAPLASRKMILYSEMEGVERVSARKALLRYRAGGKVKTLRLPLSWFKPQDAEKLVKLLEAKAGR